jgi:hypothetical protein
VKSKRTRQFRELYAVLPLVTRQQAYKAYLQFTDDPNHVGLNFKSLGGDPTWYSVRIGISYRALCKIEADAYVWFWIGSHAEYDKVLKQRRG